MKLRSPIHVHWELTNSCNMSCIHCYQRHDAARGQLTREELFLIAKRITDARVFQVTLTGGEPFSVASLLDIVEYFRVHSLLPLITSNGSYIDKSIADWLAKRGVPVQISLDSNHEGTHDRIRNYSGAFEIALNALETLVRSGVKTSVAFCASGLNHQDLERTIQLAIETGVQKFLVGEVVPLFADDDSDDCLRFTVGTYKDFIRGSIIARRRYSNLIDVQLNAEWGFLYTDEIAHSPCTAFDRDMAILFTGDVSPCPFIRSERYRFGNLLQNDVSAIWDSKKAEDFRIKKYIGCDTSCTHFEVCRSGCKAILANRNESIDKKDPSCPLL